MSDTAISRRGFLAVGAALAVLANGARAEDVAPGGAASGDVRTVQVLMQDIAFAPTAIDVHAGDTIEWVNKDPVAHTATVDDRWDIVVEPGETGTHVATRDDTVQYYCRFHPNMIGKITVVS